MENKLKVCLIFPRLKLSTGDPPLGLLYLASYLRTFSEVKVSIIDATFHPSFKYICKKIKEESPDIAGIYFDTVMYNGALKVAKMTRDLGIFTLAGGPCAAVRPEGLVDWVDIVVIGEGEETLKKIIEKFHSKDFTAIKGIWYKSGKEIFKNSSRTYIENLDILPFPARDLIEMEFYSKRLIYFDSISTNLRAATMITSRGCPYRCTFCQPTLEFIFGKKTRRRSPENLIRELKQIKKEYSLDAIYFHDDVFTLNHKWLNEFCGLMERENLNLIWGCNSRVDSLDKKLMERMYSAGLRVLHLGVESASEKVLNEIYNKGISIEQAKLTIKQAKEIGIKVMSFFMLGAPGETADEIKETIAFADSLPIDEATFSLVTPLPGTFLYRMVKDNHKFRLDDNLNNFNYYSQYAFKNPDISYPVLKYLQIKALIKFYCNPRRSNYIFKHLFSEWGWIKLRQKIYRFL
ncbi:MAG: radical SAM protein [bacterium]